MKNLVIRAQMLGGKLKLRPDSKTWESLVMAEMVLLS